MFASLLENVAAQAMRANVSSQAARFVDNLSRITFPSTAAGKRVAFFVFGGGFLNHGFMFFLATFEAFV